MNNFGQFIKSKREEHGLTLSEVAEKSGISHSHLSRVESGDRNPPKAPVLKKLARSLGITYPEIMIAAGYLNKEDYELIDMYQEEEKLEDRLIRLVKHIVNDMNEFPTKYHEQIFSIFGGYAADIASVTVGSSFRSTNDFDDWYYDYIHSEEEQITESDKEMAVEEFNRFYNYNTVKKGIENLKDRTFTKKGLSDFWNELVLFCAKEGINIPFLNNEIKESPASYNAEVELYEKSLELSDEEIKEAFSFKIDGQELTDEEYARMIAAVRAERLYRDQKKNI